MIESKYFVNTKCYKCGSVAIQNFHDRFFKYWWQAFGVVFSCFVLYLQALLLLNLFLYSGSLLYRVINLLAVRVDSLVRYSVSCFSRIERGVWPHTLWFQCPVVCQSWWVCNSINNRFNCHFILISTKEINSIHFKIVYPWIIKTRHYICTK